MKSSTIDVFTGGRTKNSKIPEVYVAGNRTSSSSKTKKVSSPGEEPTQESEPKYRKVKSRTTQKAVAVRRSRPKKSERHLDSTSKHRSHRSHTSIIYARQRTIAGQRNRAYDEQEEKIYPPDVGKNLRDMSEMRRALPDVNVIGGDEFQETEMKSRRSGRIRGEAPEKTNPPQAIKTYGRRFREETRTPSPVEDSVSPLRMEILHPPSPTRDRSLPAYYAYELKNRQTPKQRDAINKLHAMRTTLEDFHTEMKKFSQRIKYEAMRAAENPSGETAGPSDKLRKWIAQFEEKVNQMETGEIVKFDDVKSLADAAERNSLMSQKRIFELQGMIRGLAEENQQYLYSPDECD